MTKINLILKILFREVLHLFRKIPRIKKFSKFFNYKYSKFSSPRGVNFFVN